MARRNLRRKVIKQESSQKPAIKIVPDPIEAPTLVVPNFELILTPEQVAAAQASSWANKPALGTLGQLVVSMEREA